MLSLCTVPFLSASVNVVHHLCLEGKSTGAGHDKLLLDTGRALLACLLFFAFIFCLQYLLGQQRWSLALTGSLSSSVMYRPFF